MRLTRAAGVSLIEVLIALLVLSLGILSAASLQLIARRGTIDADQRTLASYFVYDLIERIRSNNDRDALGVYLSRPQLGRSAMGASPVVDCNRGPCTPVQLALFDLWNWEQALDGTQETVGIAAEKVGGLLQPTACIGGPASGFNGVYTLTLAWRGAAPLPLDTTNGCGTGLDLYGDGERFRHLMTVTAYLIER